MVQFTWQNDERGKNALMRRRRTILVTLNQGRDCPLVAWNPRRAGLLVSSGIRPAFDSSTATTVGAPTRSGRADVHVQDK